jgi:nucleotide-binding universal stress UspA family protein
MFRRILVPIDGSDAGRQGLIEALRLAPQWGSTLRLLHVACISSFIPARTSAAGLEGCRRSLKERAHHLLDEAGTVARQAGLTVEVIFRELERGAAAGAIVDEAAASDCDLVIMGTHGRTGLTRAVAGSNAEEVVRKCAVPVLVVRRSPRARQRSVRGAALMSVKAPGGVVPTVAGTAAPLSTEMP